LDKLTEEEKGEGASMSCMLVQIGANTKGALKRRAKELKKRGGSVRNIAEVKIPTGGYAAMIHVCEPASSKRPSPEIQKWITASRKRFLRFFGATK
jgi:hypothetical protein